MNGAGQTQHSVLTYFLPNFLPSFSRNRDGLAALKLAHPDIEIYVAAMDEELTQKGYVLPGLGDAGDRYDLDRRWLPLLAHVWNFRLRSPVSSTRSQSRAVSAFTCYMICARVCVEVYR